MTTLQKAGSHLATTPAAGEGICYNTRSFLTNAVLVTGGESSGGIERYRRCCFRRRRMLMCYVDESGDTGALIPTERNTQPVFLISAVIAKQPSLKQLIRAIIDLKKRFFPAYDNGLNHWHDWLKVEVKGANLRRSLREGTHDAKRHVIGFIEQLLRLMEQHHVQIVSRIYLKEPNAAFNGSSVYPAAIQRLTMAFEDKLQRENEQGILILDSWNKVKNVPVAHSIFTMKFSAYGTGYDHLAELPCSAIARTMPCCSLRIGLGQRSCVQWPFAPTIQDWRMFAYMQTLFLKLCGIVLGRELRRCNAAMSETDTSSVVSLSSLAAIIKAAHCIFLATRCRRYKRLIPFWGGCQPENATSCHTSILEVWRGMDVACSAA